MEPRARSAAPSNRRLEIVTNFFRLSRKPVGNVGLYFIEYAPEVDDNNFSLRGRLTKVAKPAIEAQIGEFIRVGNNIAACRVKPEPFTTTAIGFEEIEYTLSVRLVGTIDENRWDMYMMYSNSILKQMLKKLNLLQVTRLPKHYDRTQVAQVPAHNLEIWRGYLASFAHNSGDMLLNIDFASKIIRHTTALDVMNDIRASQPRNLREAMETELVGQIVMASYGNFQCYRIEGIEINENPLTTFSGKNGTISFKDYYKNNYNITIREARQPLIVTTVDREKRIIKLIPELCRLTGISEEMKNDYKVMNDIAQFTRLQPKDRYDVSRVLANRLQNEVTDMSNKWSLRVNAEPIRVDATRFPMETIKLGQNQNTWSALDDTGSFNVRNSILTPVNIDYWAVLSTSRDVEDRDRLVKTLQNKARQLNINLGAPYQLEYTPSNLKGLIEALNRPPQGRPAPQIGLILLPSNFRERYHDIKKACTCVSGLPTQVIMGNNVRNPKRFDSIMSKLILQMAAKTGSQLWALSPCEGLPLKTMVIGIDVFHDTVNKAKSVVGFVASIHPAYTQYYNTVKIQPKSGQEVASSVSVCLREALIAFFENTKKRFMPDHIVVYRDGVGDSQIEAVKQFETEGMKKVISSFENYAPQFTYIIVNKKTNAKLYLPAQRGLTNPLPGTVIHDGVVPDDKSFYLIAHSVTQGMASPTLYRIVDDNSGIDKMVFAKFAFKLCYMYYNWSGGIKVPAPTMMAHKLAYIVGQSVHSDYKAEVKLQPWFY